MEKLQKIQHKAASFTGITILCILCTMGCTLYKPHATESDVSLAIIVEGAHRVVIRPYLVEALERPIMTPQEEPRFQLHWGDEDSLFNCRKWQNILLIGALDSNDRVSQRLARMLQGKTLEGVREGRYTLFRKNNVWARGQTVIFIVSATRTKLAKWIEDNSKEIYKIFSEDRNNRMREQIYTFQEQKSLEDSLRQAHGWSFRIQHDYKIVANSKSPNYIRLRRELPDRFLTTAWRIGEPKEVCLDTLFAWKDRLGQCFSDPIRMNRHYYFTEHITIGGLPAIKVTGLWETIGPVGGGPSVTYLLQSGGILYLLDGQVFAPDREKETLIRQLEVILETFQPPPI